MALGHKFTVWGMIDHVVKIGKRGLGRRFGVSVNAVGVATDAIGLSIGKGEAFSKFLAVTRVSIV
jgi:hypothetical protein